MSRLNYHHLYYFWQVARSGNLTRTAQQLHVSQSALSSQIRQLEQNMEVELFERRGRQLNLTSEGKRVLTYAEDIFRKGEELESLVRRGVQPEYQQLRIGMLSTMSRNFIEHFVSPLIHKPNVRFSLHARGMTNLLDGLARHQFDLVLTNAQVPVSGDQQWQSQRLDHQPLAIVGPPALKPETDFPQGYQQMRWVLPTAQTELRAAFDGFCSLYQFEPDVLAEADDMAMLRLLARDSGALALLPEVVVRDEIASGTLVSFMTLPNVHENFYAVTIKRQFVPPVLTELLNRQPLIAEHSGQSD